MPATRRSARRTRTFGDRPLRAGPAGVQAIAEKLVKERARSGASRPSVNLTYQLVLDKLGRAGPHDHRQAQGQDRSPPWSSSATRSCRSTSPRRPPSRTTSPSGSSPAPSSPTPRRSAGSTTRSSGPTRSASRALPVPHRPSRTPRLATAPVVLRHRPGAPRRPTQLIYTTISAVHARRPHGRAEAHPADVPRAACSSTRSAAGAAPRRRSATATRLFERRDRLPGKPDYLGGRRHGRDLVGPQDEGPRRTGQGRARAWCVRQRRPALPARQDAGPPDDAFKTRGRRRSTSRHAAAERSPARLPARPARPGWLSRPSVAPYDLDHG